MSAQDHLEQNTVLLDVDPGTLKAFASSSCVSPRMGPCYTAVANAQALPPPPALARTRALVTTPIARVPTPPLPRAPFRRRPMTSKSIPILPPIPRSQSPALRALPLRPRARTRGPVTATLLLVSYLLASPWSGRDPTTNHEPYRHNQHHSAPAFHSFLYFLKLPLHFRALNAILI
ncbi:hypothetical protein B0H19DRAFT_1258392 [Mycena capillaripes]|nr:hypothetical protein B0H19DRAFT_1258392 [Mycena capillaripes]